jgi:hypothetical protein
MLRVSCLESGSPGSGDGDYVSRFGVVAPTGMRKISNGREGVITECTGKY